uniref:Glycine zipper n=1 Tax=Candidatus Kentrum sp. SD TaxID=2126332 RepID=A0A450Y5L8_9GAMM|nr:MAG: hypothetical protein BECKSD772F_GA0070984_100614 [Candidatus Kentron sp. SD]VFK40628.1 MAG: hypothetical protein BECKSD772E_GA0070983_10085 [Candidatus Kentron sp. SD]
MKPSNPLKILSLAVASALIGGCASTPDQGDQASGALLGCAGGAILGAVLGDSKAALAGCAAGAVVGWGTVKMSQYYATRTRSRTEDERYYGDTDSEFYGRARTSSRSVARIRDAVSTPEKIEAGDTITSRTTYSLVTPKGTDDATVRETYRVMKDGRTLFEDMPRPQIRQSGSWSATANFPIPLDAEPGTYVVEHEVTVGSATETRRSIFIVT